MKVFRIKFFANLFIILLLLGAGYYYRQEAGRLWLGLLNRFQPCQKPITYSIANLDPRFGLTSAELLSNIKQVEKIWEAPIDRPLFEYSSTGDLKINFIYDYRQKATDTLKKLGIAIHDDQPTYDALKAKYNSLVASYKKEKARIDALVAAYNADKKALEKDAAYWNSRRGGTKEEYDILEQRRVALNNQVAIINQAEDTFNGLVDTINSTEVVLNKLIATLNLKVSAYNAAGSPISQEFNEGEYISNAQGTVINIFQFNDSTQLLRVLAHEFGHALGLEHIDNPKAIMYYLNEGVNEKLTSDDLRAMKSRCKIQ